MTDHRPRSSYESNSLKHAALVGAGRADHRTIDRKYRTSHSANRLWTGARSHYPPELLRQSDLTTNSPSPPPRSFAAVRNAASNGNEYRPGKFSASESRRAPLAGLTLNNAGRRSPRCRRPGSPPPCAFESHIAQNLIAFGIRTIFSKG
jgi:hypothetical protein